MEIFELKNYGKIEINLKAIMEKKNISKNRLAKMVGTDNNVINRYYNGELIAFANEEHKSVIRCGYIGKDLLCFGVQYKRLNKIQKIMLFTEFDKYKQM